MSTAERVIRHRLKQEQEGRQLVSMYLPKDLVRRLQEETRQTYGDLVSCAVIDYLEKKNRAIAERP